MPLKHGVLFAFLYPSLCIGRLSENGPWRLAPLGSWSQPGHGELVNWIRRSWGSLNWGEFLFFRFCSTPIQWPSSWLQEMAALPLLLVTLLLGDVPGHWPKSLSNNRWGGGRLACFFLTHERKPLSLWVPTGWWMERVHHYVFSKGGSWATSSDMILESWVEAVWLTDHSSLTMRFRWASFSASLTWVILDFSPLQLVLVPGTPTLSWPFNWT